MRGRSLAPFWWLLKTCGFLAWLRGHEKGYLTPLSMQFSSLSPITINKVRLSAFDMTYPYQNILLIGATSGIGYVFAEKLAEDGKHMMVVGRRQDKLDELVNKYGEGKGL